MKKLIIPALLLIFSAGCRNPLPEGVKINGSYTLLNQDSTEVVFPDDFKEKILITGFIFTNCPDICPMTIHNMQLIQKKLSVEKIGNTMFAAVSFDPERDIPSVLRKESELREIDLANFSFLTGEKSEIDRLLEEMNVVAFAGDTTYTNEKPVYFFVHTDRITLVDQQGGIRKEYSGSRINIDEIISDIKYLGE